MRTKEEILHYMIEHNGNCYYTTGNNNTEDCKCCPYKIKKIKEFSKTPKNYCKQVLGNWFEKYDGYRDSAIQELLKLKQKKLDMIKKL